MTSSLIRMIIVVCCTWCIYGRTDIDCVMAYRTWVTPTSLTINWTIPRLAANREDLDVNITWYSLLNIGSCPNDWLTSCTWHYGQGMNFDVIFNLSVIITEKASKSIVYRKEWEVNPDDCRKPPPIDHVAIETMNSTCINVRWWYNDESGCSSFDHKYYHISYTNNDTADTKVYNLDNAALETSCNISRVVCYLHPFTNYVFTIQTKFSDWQLKIRGHFSKIKTSNVKTPEDVPTGVPGVTRGCFTMVQNKCTDENIRVVRIYWKDVSTDLKHGIITHFMVDIFNKAPTRRKHVTSSLVHGRIYNYLATISCDADYEIRLRAATSVGTSSVYSSLTIPRLNKDYQDVVVDVVPVIADDSFLVHWLSNSRTDNTSSYRVFWCFSDIENRCKSPINWIEVSDNQTFLNVTETAASVSHRYRFGAGYFESGIKWSRCLYTQTEDSNPPVGLKLVPQKSSAAGSMTIYWDNLPCESHPPGPYIHKFIVKICKHKDGTSCQDEPVTDTVDGGRNNHVFNDLDTNVDYLICVQSRGISRHHLSPKNCIIGHPSSQRTKRLHPGLILVFVLGSVVLVSVSTYAVEKVKKVVNKKVPISLPEDLYSTGHKSSDSLPLTEYQRIQISSDSSVDSSFTNQRD